MFKNGIDLKTLGIWNLVITAIVLLIRLLASPTEALQSALWVLPLFTLGLGLLLIYRSTKQLEKGNAVLRVRMILFVGSVLFLAVKYQPLPEQKTMWMHIAASIMLLAGLGWYFIRWITHKSVAI